MSRKYTQIRVGDLKIGYTTNPIGRKRPQLIVVRGNTEYQLASFSDEAKAEFFFDALCDIVGLDKDTVENE